MKGTLKRGDNATMARGVYTAFNPRSVVINAIIQAFYFFVVLGSIPARLLVRKNMGERAFSIFIFILSVTFYLSISILVFLGISDYILEDFKFISFDLDTSWQNPLFYLMLILVNPLSFFIVWILSKGAEHFKRIIRRIKQNKVGYSYYRGDSIHFEENLEKQFLGFPNSDAIIRLILEPIAILKWASVICVLSIAILYVSSSFIPSSLTKEVIDFFYLGFVETGVLLILSSIFLIIEEFSILSQIRDQILDFVDGDIEMEMTLKARNLLQLESEFQKKSKNNDSQISIASN